MSNVSETAAQTQIKTHKRRFRKIMLLLCFISTFVFLVCDILGLLAHLGYCRFGDSVLHPHELCFLVLLGQAPRPGYPAKNKVKAPFFSAKCVVFLYRYRDGCHLSCHSRKDRG